MEHQVLVNKIVSLFIKSQDEISEFSADLGPIIHPNRKRKRPAFKLNLFPTNPTIASEVMVVKGKLLKVTKNCPICASTFNVLKCDSFLHLLSFGGISGILKVYINFLHNKGRETSLLSILYLHIKTFGLFPKLWALESDYSNITNI